MNIIADENTHLLALSKVQYDRLYSKEITVLRLLYGDKILAGFFALNTPSRAPEISASDHILKFLAYVEITPSPGDHTSFHISLSRYIMPTTSYSFSRYSHIFILSLSISLLF